MIIILLIYSPLMFAITKEKLMKRRNIDNNTFLLKIYLSKRYILGTSYKLLYPFKTL